MPKNQHPIEQLLKIIKPNYPQTSFLWTWCDIQKKRTQAEWLICLPSFIQNQIPKNEAAFTTRLLRIIRDAGGFAHKISDMDFGFKPADCFVAIDGFVGLIEIKFTKETDTLNIPSLLRPNQISWLEKFDKNSWNAYIFVYNKDKDILFIANYSNLYEIWKLKISHLLKKADGV